MSRAHAVAPSVAEQPPFRGPVQRMAAAAQRAARRPARPTTSFYLERAMLLWPRLDRARIRKVADDPSRIAEIVERRTSQPFAVILAMLTRQSPALDTSPRQSSVSDYDRTRAPRTTLRIVRSRDGDEIGIQDLLHA
jgi:hypothetical protein